MSKILCEFIKSSQKYISFYKSLRLYSRNSLHRKPIRILNTPEEKLDSLNENDLIPPKKYELHVDTGQSQVAPFIEKQSENVVSYEKIQKNDGRLIKTLTTLKSRTKREKSGKVLLEGKRLINDAIKAGLQLQIIYFTREKELSEIKLKNPEEVQVYKVLYKTMKVWSNLTTPPGIMAVFRRPSVEDISVISQAVLPVTIICDNIREPGNLGSIIRTAAAAGCENIFLMKGCVDPWEVKVLRSACGGHFRIPVVNNIEWDLISNYIPSSSTIFIADNKADIDELHCESDFIYYDEDEENDGNEEEKEETKYITFNDHNQSVSVDETFNDSVKLKKYEGIELPCHLYSSIKYPKNNIVLCVGGETHGIDPRINKLACEYGGRKVKIPLENGMDSLNSAFAVSIILYEIKRQLGAKVFSTK